MPTAMLVLDTLPPREFRAGVAEITISLPNHHYLLADLAPFGLDNPGEIFVATDRPYGLIEARLSRAGR